VTTQAEVNVDPDHCYYCRKSF